MAVAEHRFRVMASETLVVTGGADPTAAATDAEAFLRALEQLWSRFVADSDITRLNRNAGQWVEVAPHTVFLLDAMKQAATVTDGAYDPTLVFELFDAGYETSVVDSKRVNLTVDLPCLDHDVLDVDIDQSGCRVRLPGPMAIDPGGIGKGLAADLCVAWLLDRGESSALVNIGGDLAAGGQAISNDGWVVAVADPTEADRSLLSIAIDGGGVATSSVLSRRWTKTGKSRHHVIDPSTRTCSTTDLVSVTVVAGSGWLAEVHATAALLAGSTGALSYLQARDLSGVAVGADGSFTMTSDLRNTRGPTRIEAAV